MVCYMFMLQLHQGLIFKTTIKILFIPCFGLNLNLLKYFFFAMVKIKVKGFQQKYFFPIKNSVNILYESDLF